MSKSDHFNELLLRYGTRTSCFRLINRRIIEEYNLRFDEVLVYNDDMFSVMLGRYLKKFAVSNEVIYCIGESEQSLSQKRSLAHYYSYLFVLVRLYDYMKQCISSYEMRRIGYANTGYAVLSSAIRKYEVNMYHVYKTLKILKQARIPILLPTLRKARSRILRKLGLRR